MSEVQCYIPSHVYFLRSVFTFSPNPEIGGPPLFNYQRLRIDYMSRYTPQLQAVSSDRNFPS